MLSIFIWWWCGLVSKFQDGWCCSLIFSRGTFQWSIWQWAREQAWDRVRSASWQEWKDYGCQIQVDLCTDPSSACCPTAMVCLLPMDRTEQSSTTVCMFVCVWMSKPMTILFNLYHNGGCIDYITYRHIVTYIFINHLHSNCKVLKIISTVVNNSTQWSPQAFQVPVS